MFYLLQGKQDHTLQSPSGAVELGDIIIRLWAVWRAHRFGIPFLVMAVLEGEAYVSQAITLVFIAQKIERILAKKPELLPPGDKYIPDYDEEFDENLIIPDFPED